MKRIFALVLALLMVTVALASCAEENKKEYLKDITVCVGPDPETIDPALNSSVDGAIMLTNACEGVYAYAAGADGKPVIVPGCAKEIVKPTALEGGKYQYVITLKDGLKWSDGKELKASDFAYSWQRAAEPATAADYCYMFDVIDGFSYEDDCKLNVVADDEKNTLTIITGSFCSYFDQLLAFPTYYPVRKDLVEAGPDTWATKPETYVTNGPFRMKSWTVGSQIVFEKNPNYWDADSVKLDTITFFLSDDDDAIFANYTNGTIQYTTTVPVAQIPTLKADANRMNKDFFIGDYIGTYYLEFNVEKSFAPEGKTFTEKEDAEIRYAFSLLIDRNYIVENITAAGQTPAYGFVPAGMGDGTGKIFRSEAEKWWSVDKADLESNRATAVEILKKYYTYDEAAGKFTDIPKFEYSINPTSGNVAIAEAIQSQWSAYGIEVSIDTRTWSVIQTALTEGDFTMCRLGWIADYDDPVNFLEILLSGSGNNHPHLGKDGANGSAAIYGPNGNQKWADYDELIAKIKTEADAEKRAEYMYEAEEWIRDTYTIIPLYYYTNPYLASPNLEGYLYSNLGWVSFKNATFSK